MRVLREKGAGILAIGFLLAVILAAVFAPYFLTHGPTDLNVMQLLKPPTKLHPLGTDGLGRDILARVLFGARVSLLVGATSVAVAFLIGVPLGIVAGFYGGFVDQVIMRAVDLTLSIPRFLLALLLVTILGTGMNNIILAVGIWSAPMFARMTRGPVLIVREQLYVEGARAAGANDLRIILKYVLPNVAGRLVVLSVLGMAGAILAESGLSFLGLGIQPPTPSWGVMLADGQAYLRNAPHVSTFPGLAIFAVVLALNVASEAIRDWLDPQAKRR